MSLERNVLILTSWCAVSPEAEHSVFPRLVFYARGRPDLASTWEQLLRDLGATRLIRLSNRLRPQPEATSEMLEVKIIDGGVEWQGQQIGQIQTYYKAPSPQEIQARIAYEVFYERFARFITQRYKAVVISESDFHLELFLPVGMENDMAAMWREFVPAAFSGSALRESFINLVNTVKLAERGFSALSVPIVSQEQAIYLCAFYLANLSSLQNGDRRRKNDIHKLQGDLDQASEKDAIGISRQIAKLEKELADRQQRYGPFYQTVFELKRQYPNKMAQVERIAAEQFRGMAGTQVSKVGSKIGKAIDSMAELLTVEDDALYRFPLLITSEPAISVTRPGGDDSAKLCYACGRVLTRREPAFSANKFVFESPSQRPQSGGAQTQPKICGTCAAVSFISPIKIGSGRVIVRMRLQEDPLDERKGEQSFQYRAGDQLRMFIMDEMGVIAGNYVLLQASERVGDKLVSDQLGGEQYALYKVAISFLPEVFRQFTINAIAGRAEIDLPGGQLAVLRRLSDIFTLARGRWDDKGQFAAFGRAIRQVQRDELTPAIYELATSEIVSVGQGWGIERAAALEDLRKEHVEWLEMSNVDLAQQYKDIAAMTALVYPFVDEVRKELRGDPSKQRIEVRKVIERADNVHEFMYTVGPLITDSSEEHDYLSVRAFLNRTADTYFSYDQLLALFGELSHQPNARVKGKGESILLTFGDLEAAYTHLLSTRYASEKAWREFTYKLRLSLAARFPQFYGKKDSDKE